MTTDRLSLEITVLGFDDGGTGVEVGLQSTRGDLQAGTPVAGGGLRYGCEVTTTVRGDGSTGYRGDYVHGPANERFLYLSARRPGEEAWLRRLKIMLPGRVDAATTRLRARVRDERRARAGIVDGWSAV